MKRLLFILTALASTTLAGPAFDQPFMRAGQAYDDGRYTEAAQHYEQLLDDGVENMEVHYNLANARFKAGNLPEAVRHYRLAWYRAPRDPDIHANLRFALNAAGAVEPAPALIERTLTSLSAREWLWGAAGSYLCLCLFTMLALLIGRARRALLKIALAPAALLLAAAGGWAQWQVYRTNPEAVVTAPETMARFGPLEGAKVHYRLPPGALVRQRTTDPRGWIEVEYDGKTGWVKQDHIAPLFP